jgi:hypothetical protein
MRTKRLHWIMIALFGIVIVTMISPCFADGDDTEPGDPYELPPGSNSLDPTPRTLSDFWMIVMAMAFQLAL